MKLKKLDNIEKWAKALKGAKSVSGGYLLETIATIRRQHEALLCANSGSLDNKAPFRECPRDVMKKFILENIKQTQKEWGEE